MSRPLHAKLGFKPGHRVWVRNRPERYQDLLGPGVPDVEWCEDGATSLDMVHWFVMEEAEFMLDLPRVIGLIKPSGMIWISWPKQSSRVPTDVKEETIRQGALPLGLVDVKVCSVSDVWSALKLVIRKERRQ